MYPVLRSTELYKNHIKKEKQQVFSTDDLSKKKNAFATVVCDPQLMEATIVSIYSLNAAFAKNPSSKSDIVVLVPESIQTNKEAIYKLDMLGARVIRTSFPLEKECQLMMHLWALFDYEKVIYFSPDVMFKDNVDQLTDIPVHAAIITNENDIPLFVLEPSSGSYESLVRGATKLSNNNYNGTINKRFMELIKEDYIQKRIPARLIDNVAQIFSGPVKPWNFHAYKDTDWKKYYRPSEFYKWRSASNNARKFLEPRTDWVNQDRQSMICDSYLSTSNTSHFPVKNQFSVMLSTYNPERIEHISLIIRHLLKSEKVHTVFVTWHNPALDIPPSLYDKIEESDYHRVKVLRQSFDSLNNRFNPEKELVTEAVYIMDDDIFTDLVDLENSFDIWITRKDSIVGHFPRIHNYDPMTEKATYKVTRKAPYSIILTKSMFIRSEYLFAYTCLLEPKLHADVDRQLNCEDLGFAMMASGMSGVGSTFVRTQRAMEDFGLKKGISTNSAHMPARAVCISDFITNYWNKRDPLIKSYDTTTAFSRPQVKTGNWDRISKMIG
ncbi:glycosyltransferase family 64 protein [Backusella circina FSU 941]|nr:glycosyltransferase family 64 protein [Backusella circina FSU 941]